MADKINEEVLIPTDSTKSILAVGTDGAPNNTGKTWYSGLTWETDMWNTGKNLHLQIFNWYTSLCYNKCALTLSETGSGTYVVKQGGANLPRMTFGF